MVKFIPFKRIQRMTINDALTALEDAETDELRAILNKHINYLEEIECPLFRKKLNSKKPSL